MFFCRIRKQEYTCSKPRFNACVRLFIAEISYQLHSEGGHYTVNTTRATIEVHQPLFFSGVVFNLRAQDISQTLIWKKYKTCFIADEKIYGLGTQQESCKRTCTIFFFFPDDLGLRNPVIQKPFQTKSDTSIVPRVTTCICIMNARPSNTHNDRR